MVNLNIPYVAISADEKSALQMLERFTLQLHELIRKNQGDSPEADALRDDMVDVWNRLRPDHQALLNGLSGDLYMLQGDEVLESSEAPTGQTIIKLKEAWKHEKWSDILVLLRQEEVQRELPKNWIAYARGRGWSALGFQQAASCFYDYASTLAPTSSNYGFLALDALLRSGQITEAEERANAILRNEQASSRILNKVAYVLFHAARHRNESLRPIEYRRILSVLDQALQKEKSEPPSQRIPSLNVGGMVLKGLCHENLGELNEAKSSYTAALAIDPKNDAALTARALLLYDTEPELALRDFEQAVGTGTPLVWPYMYLAYEALRKGEPERCIEMALQALAKGPGLEVRANLLEWMAIAGALQGLKREPIEILEEASALNPFNKRIASNLADMRVGKDGSSMRIENDLIPPVVRKQFGHALALAA